MVELLGAAGQQLATLTSGFKSQAVRFGR